MSMSYSMSLYFFEDDYLFTQSDSSSKSGKSSSSKGSKGSSGCVDETMPSTAPSVSLAPSSSASPSRIVCFAARPSNPPSYSPTYEPSFFPTYLPTIGGKSAKQTKSVKSTKSSMPTPSTEKPTAHPTMKPTIPVPTTSRPPAAKTTKSVKSQKAIKVAPSGGVHSSYVRLVLCFVQIEKKICPSLLSACVYISRQCCRRRS